jgi:FKBP-type peptidyl-prolyl cis-trans isomerase 2
MNKRRSIFKPNLMRRIMVVTKKNDFVELRYTGIAQGNVFDSNIEEDLKKMNTREKPRKTIVMIGKGMLVKGFDDALEGKEVGKEYEIKVGVKDGFGDRKRDLVKTIPLKIFTEKKISPYPGLVLAMDDMLAKVITVSGARVVTDFNNPLAGKELNYNFTIVRKVEDEKEKAETLFEFLLRFVPPEIEIKDSVVVRGPKELGFFIGAVKDKFKELMGKDLKFEERIEKKDKTENEKKEEHVHGPDCKHEH